MVPHGQRRRHCHCHCHRTTKGYNTWFSKRESISWWSNEIPKAPKICSIFVDENVTIKDLLLYFSLALSFSLSLFYRCWSEEHSNQLLRINHHQHHHICLRSYSRCRLFHCNAICYCSRLPVIVVSIVTTAVVCCCPMVSCVCKWLLKLKR